MEKIKAFIESDRGKDVLTVLIVVLVGLGSFGLGRLSKGQNSPGIEIEYPGELNVETAGQGAAAVQAIKSNSGVLQKTGISQSAQTGNFFASNRGSKYYPVGCSAGDSLKMENRVYFETREAAESAGYTLSSSCR